MAAINNLTLKSLLKRKGRHGLGRGLALKVVDDARAYFTARYRFGGCERETSLGSAYEITLSDAKVKHLAILNTLHNEKRDPLAARDNSPPATTGAVTFGEAAEAYVERRERLGEWKNAKHRWQWRASLMKLLPASFRSLPVDRIDPEAIFAALDPIWTATPETGSRLLGRIGKVIASARSSKDTRPNPAKSEWLKEKLGSAKKLGKIDRRTGERVARGHHAAMPYSAVPALIVQLRDMDSTAARALEFAILTGCRTSEVLGMPWGEIGDGQSLDQLKPTWSIPAARMKGTKRTNKDDDAPHDVPLGDRAVAILRERLAHRSASGFGDHPFVFPGEKHRRPLSNMALLMVLRRMKLSVTAHGFRSSFRDWASEAGVDFETAEMCLAHQVGNAVTRAYLRTKNLEQRRIVMQR